jgi:hypothetical protein
MITITEETTVSELAQQITELGLCPIEILKAVKVAYRLRWEPINWEECFREDCEKPLDDKWCGEGELIIH